MKLIRKFFITAASVKLTVFCLFTISFLVVWGTFYQVDSGVYAAQKRFFDSWYFIIAGMIPFPGVKSIIAVLALNIVASGACRISFHPARIGILLMHIGTLALIAGTAFSSFLIRESVLILFEGERSDVSSKQFEWEIAFFKKESGSLINAGFHKFNNLKTGKNIPFSMGGITVSVEQIYSNCNAFGTSPHKIDSLQLKDPDYNRERNIPGLVLRVNKDGDKKKNNKVVLYGGAGVPALCILGSDTLLISLQPGHIQLPVEIELIKFTKEEHPGTKTAKSYNSRVRVKGPELNREVVISMNRPFRYKTFTFYQSSYSNENGRTASTLSVVDNPVRFVPYVTGIIIMLGLLYHFIFRFLHIVLEPEQNNIPNEKKSRKK